MPGDGGSEVKRLAGLVAAASLLSPLQVRAQACADRETLIAAQVHEFETMMLAVSLRCKAIGVDISADYEAMLATHAPVFRAADRMLRAHFAAEAHAYDRFSTQVGNRYGAGATDPANCNRFDSVARQLAAQPAVAALGKVVGAMVSAPRLGAEACSKP